MKAFVVFYSIMIFISTGLTPALARELLDQPIVGRVSAFSNDYLGDGHDRWRTGAYFTSYITSHTKGNFFDNPTWFAREFRIRSEIIAPSNLGASAKNIDRHFVGMIGTGIFFHRKKNKVESKYGFELVFTGPMTGLLKAQSIAHKPLTFEPVSKYVIDSQHPNRIYSNFSYSLARPFQVGSKNKIGVSIRPFVRFDIGVESFARIGADIIIGKGMRYNFFVRDPVTGNLMTGQKSFKSGLRLGVLFGGDVSYMATSAYFNSNRGEEMIAIRHRFRVGVQLEVSNLNIFFGITKFSKEFKKQKTGQSVGSIEIRIRY